MKSLNLFESLLCISPFFLCYALVNVIHKHRILIPCHKYHMMTIISTMASTMNDSDSMTKSIKLIKNFRPKCAAKLNGIDSKLECFTLAYLLHLTCYENYPNMLQLP